MIIYNSQLLGSGRNLSASALQEDIIVQSKPGKSDSVYVYDRCYYAEYSLTVTDQTECQALPTATRKVAVRGNVT